MRADSSAGEKGFGDVVVRAAFQAADLVVLLAARGQHDDRRRPGFRLAADLAADLDAAGHRQHPVEQDQVGRILVDDDQRLVPVAALRRRRSLHAPGCNEAA